jgi:hypothetical protein
MFYISLLLVGYGVFSLLRREDVGSRDERQLRHKINEISAEFDGLMQTHDFLSERVHREANI